VSLRITSAELKKSLADVWGVFPNKSKTATMKETILNSPFAVHFFRGLFDGDGCVHRRGNGYFYANLCGTPNIIDSFRDFCWKSIRETGNLQRRTSYTHVVQFGSRAAPLLGKLLYGVDGPRLHRKERVFCG